MPLNGTLLGAMVGLFILGPLGFGISGLFLGLFGGFAFDLSRILRLQRNRSQKKDHLLVPMFSLFAKVCQETGGPTNRQIQYLGMIFQTQFVLGWFDQEVAQEAFNEALSAPEDSQHWINELSGFPLDGFRKHWILQTVAQLLSMEGNPGQQGLNILQNLSRAFGYGYRFAGGTGQGYRRPSQDQPVFEDPKEVLGLGRSAGPSEIKKRYRQLVKEYHPDRLQNLAEDDPQKTKAEQQFLKIQQAYENLKLSMGFS